MADSDSFLAELQTVSVAPDRVIQSSSTEFTFRIKIQFSVNLKAEKKDDFDRGRPAKS